MKTPIFRRKGYVMRDDTVVALRHLKSFSDDPLTDILRARAQQFLAQAIEAEVEGHIAAPADLTDAEARSRVVRHGSLPEREIQTGIGACVAQVGRRTTARRAHRYAHSLTTVPDRSSSEPCAARQSVSSVLAPSAAANTAKVSLVMSIAGFTKKSLAVLSLECRW